MKFAVYSYTEGSGEFDYICTGKYNDWQKYK